jgi:hypothetical protein
MGLGGCRGGEALKTTGDGKTPSPVFFCMIQKSKKGGKYGVLVVYCPCTTLASDRQEGFFMYAIKAVYDGTNIKLRQPIPVKGNYEVIITFIEPENKDEAILSANTPVKLPRATAKGLLKGKVWMSADFNEPLEEMREYME